MSDFVRQALQQLQGNQLKLWLCLVEYRQPHTLEMFAERAGLDLATVKRLLKTDAKRKPEEPPGIVGDTYIAVDRSQRPHRYTLASQLCLRFTEDAARPGARAYEEAQNATFGTGRQAPKVAKRDSKSAEYDFGEGAKVAFCDSLYLDSAEGIYPSVSVSKIDSRESRKTPLWKPENAAVWQEENISYARQSAQAVGDREQSLGWHIRLWAHARRTDAVYQTTFRDQLFTLLKQMQQERHDSGRAMGSKFNARASRLFYAAGHPLGKFAKPQEQTDDATQLVLQRDASDTNPGPGQGAGPDACDPGSRAQQFAARLASGR